MQHIVHFVARKMGEFTYRLTDRQRIRLEHLCSVQELSFLCVNVVYHSNERETADLAVISTG